MEMVINSGNLLKIVFYSYSFITGEYSFNFVFISFLGGD